LHLLLIEDSPADVELIEYELRRAGFDFVSRCVATQDQLNAALDERTPDLVISDYSMPGFNGIAALTTVRARHPGVPFIFVSGTIGEERAIDALQRGATDYVLKDRLVRLLPAVQRALDDVRERERAKQLEKQLIEAQKMEAVGRLASGVAHDFNNLLSVILANVELAGRGADPEVGLPQELDEIREAARRAASLTRRLLAISRPQAAEPAIFDLNRLVTDLQRMLRSLLGDDTRLDLELASEALTVHADSGQVEQVLLNLVINARDALPNGGTVTIRTGIRRPTTALGELPAGRYALLAVHDTGVGMSPEVRARLFEPFFTTKPPGKGTGLGLATSQAIMRESGGTILVDSLPGVGTTLEVLLPLAGPMPTVRISAPHAEGGLPRGNETLLLVEDDPMLGAVENRVLTMLGYRVLRTIRAEDALELLERHGGEIDLLITDVVLPGMNGIQLAAEVRRRRPDLRVLFMSGYAENDALLEAARTTFASLLPKPFVLADFAGTVRRVLDESTGADRSEQ
jgi:signal transduction histidine kinase